MTSSSTGLFKSPAGDSSEPLYFPLFDWLRFVLACIVMFVHFGAFNFWPEGGGFAVSVFFALSGWLIGGILLATTADDLPRFYFNRSVRIWVPYFIGLGLLLAASIIRDTSPFSAKWWEFVAYQATFVWNLFGTQQLATANDAMPLKGVGNHFWSVNAEEQFYLLAPLLLVVCVPRIGRSLITWVLIAALAYITSTYASIVFGIVAAIFHRRSPFFYRHRSIQFGLVAIILCSAYLLSRATEMSLVAPWCGIAIVLLLAKPGRPSRLGRIAGGLSYQLYLNHWVGIFVAGALLIPVGLRGSPVKVPLGIAVAIGLAYALYVFIDKPLLASRERLFKRVHPKAAMWAGYGVVSIGIAIGLSLTRR